MLESYARGIFLLLSAWSLWFPVFVGCGLVVRRLFGLTVQDAHSVLTSFWMGWALILCLLQLWHFAFPVDWRAFFLVFTLGMAGVTWNLKHIVRYVKSFRIRHGFVILILLVSAVWIANHSIAANLPFDVGLYHIPTLKWTKSFSIVPGLGNLHSRLAFNSSFFLYVSLLDVGPWVGKSHRLANGLLLLPVLAQIYLSGMKLFLSREIQVYHIFNVLLLGGVLNLVLHYSFPSAWADLCVFLLGVVVSSQLLLILENTRSDRRQFGYAVLFIIALSAVGCTIKMSFLVLGVATSLFALAVWHFGRGGEDRFNNRVMVWWTCAVAIMVVMPWMIRSIVLSGYPVFPSTFCPFPVEWRMPYANVTATVKSIIAYARSDVPWKGVAGDLDWVTPWITVIGGRFEVVGPLFLMLVGLFVKLCRKSKGGDSGGVPRRVWLFMFPPILSLPYWLLTAPSVRFAGASLWIIGAGTAALCIGGVPAFSSRAKSWTTVLLCIIVCQRVFIGGHRNYVFTMIEEKDFFGAFEQLYRTGALVVTKPMNSGGYFDLPSVQTETFTTDSGLTVYVPTTGNKCWESPLPCTPDFNAHLQLRENNDLSRGFIIDDGQADYENRSGR